MKGLDVGTMNIVGAEAHDDGDKVKIFRNCFIEIGSDEADDVRDTGGRVVEVNDKFFLIGDDAIKTARIAEAGQKADKKTSILHRPMRNGVLNPSEENAAMIMQKIFEGVIGLPSYAGEVVCASIPANSTDSTVETSYHSAIVLNSLRTMGYRPIIINEGLAIIFAENPTIETEDGQVNMTGIGISFGAGLTNFCFAYRKRPLITFSSTFAGDWIDKQVAKVRNTSVSKVTLFKERHFNFVDTYIDAGGKTRLGKSEEELKKAGIVRTRSDLVSYRLLYEALEIYYRMLIEKVIDNFSSKFEENDDNDKRIEEPIEIVVSGGTSKPDGFVDYFKQVLDNVDFPFNVRCVRAAENQLEATAIGALVSAISAESKLKSMDKIKPEEDDIDISDILNG